MAAPRLGLPRAAISAPIRSNFCGRPANGTDGRGGGGGGSRTLPGIRRSLMTDAAGEKKKKNRYRESNDTSAKLWLGSASGCVKFENLFKNFDLSQWSSGFSLKLANMFPLLKIYFSVFKKIYISNSRDIPNYFVVAPSVNETFNNNLIPKIIYKSGGSLPVNQWTEKFVFS